jgi:hypothetical protein
LFAAVVADVAGVDDALHARKTLGHLSLWHDAVGVADQAHYGGAQAVKITHDFDLSVPLGGSESTRTIGNVSRIINSTWDRQALSLRGASSPKALRSSSRAPAALPRTL